MNEFSLLKKLQVALTEYNNSNEENNLTTLFIHLRKAWDYVDLNISSNGHLKDLGDLVIKSRNRIWVNHLDLVKPIAKRYARIFPGIDYSDLEAEGNLGQPSIIKNFDPYQGIPFSHYVTRSTKNNIERAIYEKWLTIKLPSNSFPKYYEMLYYFEKDFKERLNRSPTDRELSNFTHRSIKFIKNFKWMIENLYNTESLNNLILDDGKDQKYLIDSISDENSDFENETIREILKQKLIEEYIPKLPDAEKSVFLGQLENKTLADIAKEKNCTRKWTSQLKIRGVEKIEALMEFKEIKKICGVE